MMHDPICAGCGRPLPTDAPRGLCPGCLLWALLSDEGDPGGSPGEDEADATAPAEVPETGAPVPAERPASPP
jgi:hypothetical protein